jgi:hypothetical protein
MDLRRDGYGVAEQKGRRKKNFRFPIASSKTGYVNSIGVSFPSLRSRTACCGDLLRQRVHAGCRDVEFETLMRHADAKPHSL